jgi:type VI secretion system secreted protein Hcp
MAFDAFIKIDGVPGESTDDKHKDWIELIGYAHGISQPASSTVSTAGGATAGRVNMQDFSITKFLDKASPKLAELCCTGKHIKDVTIELCRAGGDKLKYMEIKMEEVIIASVGANGAPKGENFPTETVGFNFGKIKWTYTQQKRADGSGGGNVTGGWDLTKNKVAS